MQRCVAAAVSCVLSVCGATACAEGPASGDARTDAAASVLIERHSAVPPGPYGIDVQFRTESGLDASISHIRAVHQLARARPGQVSTAWAAPITLAEERQIFHRDSVLSDNADAARIWAENNPDIYAGVYLDQSADGSSVVLVLDDPIGALTELKQVVPHPDMVSTREVDVTAGQGNALADQIVADEEDVLRSAGVDVVGAGFSLMAQRVQVDVEGNLHHAAAVLAEHYPAELPASSAERRSVFNQVTELTNRILAVQRAETFVT